MQKLYILWYIKIHKNIKYEKYIWDLKIFLLSHFFSLIFCLNFYLNYALHYWNYEKLYLFITEFIIMYQDFLFLWKC